MENKTKDRITKPWAVCLLALVCTLLWGSAFPCVKIGYQMFRIQSGDTGSQILFAGYRFALAGIMTWLIAVVMTKSAAVPEKGLWGKIFILGVIQTGVQYFFFYIGMANTSAVKGSIISGTNSLFSIVLAHFMVRGERMNLRKAIGCLLGFLGVVVINLAKGGAGGGFALMGDGFMLLAALAYGLAAVYVKGFAHRENPLIITAFQLFLGGLLLIGAGLAMGGKVQGFTVESTLLLVYMAFISSVAFTLWTLLLKYNPVGLVSIYGFTIPVFGILLSAVILGEQVLTARNILALFCVSLGIIVVNAQMSCNRK